MDRTNRWLRLIIVSKKSNKAWIGARTRVIDSPGKMVLIANFMAWPAAYFAKNKWLQNFTYHIDKSCSGCKRGLFRKETG